MVVEHGGRMVRTHKFGRTGTQIVMWSHNALETILLANDDVQLLMFRCWQGDQEFSLK